VIDGAATSPSWRSRKHSRASCASSWKYDVAASLRSPTHPIGVA
jgi:hypothetical protein